VNYCVIHIYIYTYLHTHTHTHTHTHIVLFYIILKKKNFGEERSIDKRRVFVVLYV